MNYFCKCGYLPPVWRRREKEECIGSVPIRRRPGEMNIAYQYCWAVGYRWGWDLTRCPKDPEKTIQGIPLCKRHARIATCTLPHDSRSVEQRWQDRTARYEHMPLWVTDGGRKDAGFKYTGGDCVYRAIAIAEGKPYAEVAEALFSLGASKRRKGVPKYVYAKYLFQNGWREVKVKGIHLRKGSLPQGRLLVSTSRHMLAVIDGMIHDTYDSSGRGSRRVLSYYTKEAV